MIKRKEVSSVVDAQDEKGVRILTVLLEKMSKEDWIKCVFDWDFSWASCYGHVLILGIYNPCEIPYEKLAELGGAFDCYCKIQLNFKKDVLQIEYTFEDIE